MMHIRMMNCQMKDLDTIYILSQTLAHYFPQPEYCVAGIHELLLNALEHGNLGIGFEEKSLLLYQKKWHEEIRRRLAMPEHAEKVVDITLTHDAHACTLTIADQGEGFRWKEYLGRTADVRRPNGRGLWLAMNSKFDAVSFNPAGNVVTCTVRYEGAGRAD